MFVDLSFILNPQSDSQTFIKPLLYPENSKLKVEHAKLKSYVQNNVLAMYQYS